LARAFGARPASRPNATPGVAFDSSSSRGAGSLRRLAFVDAVVMTTT